MIFCALLHRMGILFCSTVVRRVWRRVLAVASSGFVGLEKPSLKDETMAPGLSDRVLKPRRARGGNHGVLADGLLGDLTCFLPYLHGKSNFGVKSVRPFRAGTTPYLDRIVGYCNCSTEPILCFPWPFRRLLHPQ